jgi:hypothetical protein
MLLKTKRQINLVERQIGYTLNKSSRARYLRLEISCSAGLVVTAPRRLEISAIEKFIVSKADWVLARLDYFLYHPSQGQPILGHGRRDYLKNKEAARELIRSRLVKFNDYYGLVYKQVKIKNQKSRWGSCSRRGNLNFNYKISKLPSSLADYIIVHELCHLAHFNHSGKFWRLVAETIPDWRARRKALNEYSASA